VNLIIKQSQNVTLMSDRSGEIEKYLDSRCRLGEIDSKQSVLICIVWLGYSSAAGAAGIFSRRIVRPHSVLVPIAAIQQQLVASQTSIRPQHRLRMTGPTRNVERRQPTLIQARRFPCDPRNTRGSGAPYRHFRVARVHCRSRGPWETELTDIDPTAGQDLPAKMKDAAAVPMLAPSSSVEAHRLIPTDGAAMNQRQDAMHEFGITYDGRSYQYHGYQYDQLADALGYAKLVHSAPGDHAMGPCVPRPAISLPTVTELSLMTSLGISLEAGFYRFQDFRYDQLADAVSYAALKR
jgi:hypothetical protein